MTLRSLKPLAFFLIILAFTGLACSVDLFGSAPTEPPGPVEAAATVAPTASAAAGSGGADPAPFFTEEFEGEPASWSYFTTKNDSQADDSGVAPFTEDSFFVFDIGKNLNVYATYDSYTYDDVRIDVRVENRGVNDNNINLICRYSDSGWYEVSVANSGLYWIYAVTDAYHRLADGGSNNINQGTAVNEYTLICNDRNIRLFINGDDTRTFTDNQYGLSEGQIGIGLSSFDSEPVEVGFDWVAVSEP